MREAFGAAPRSRVGRLTSQGPPTIAATLVLALVSFGCQHNPPAKPELPWEVCLYGDNAGAAWWRTKVCSETYEGADAKSRCLVQAKADEEEEADAGNYRRFGYPGNYTRFGCEQIPQPPSTTPVSEALRLESAAFQLEDGTFDDIRAAFGPARPQHNGGDAAGSLHFICYEGLDETRLFVVGNEMAGGGANGFQLLDQTASFSETDFIYGSPHLKTKPHCDRSDVLSSKQQLGMGLRLGLSRGDVISVLGQPTRVEQNRLIYEKDTPVHVLRDGGPAPAWGYSRLEVLIVSLAQERVVALSGLRITRN